MCLHCYLMRALKKQKKRKERKPKPKVRKEVSEPSGPGCCSRCCQNVNSFFDRCPMLRSILGFIIGMVLSFLWFLMMVKQMNYHPKTAAIASAAIGVFFTLGLAFSTACRCITVLIFPNMCSSNGRLLLLGYVLVLVMTNPVPNYKENIHVMSDTVTCTQELAYNMTQQLVDAASAPFAGIMNDIQQIMNGLVAFSKRLEESFNKVRDLFVEVIASINKVFEWLADMVTVCNDKMGAPYRKCVAPLDRAYEDCKRKMKFLKFTCGIITGIKAICNIARIGELLCKITEAIQNAVKTHITSRALLMMMESEDPIDMDWNDEFIVKSRPAFIPDAERVPGPTIDQPPGPNAADYFQLYMDDEFMQDICNLTNRNAFFKIETDPNNNKGKWTSLTVPELKAYIGVWVIIEMLYRDRIQELWSNNPKSFLTNVPGISDVFARDRFRQITRYLHFCNEQRAIPRESADYDKLYKIRYLLCHIQQKFQEMYIPDEDMSLDECMVPFRGRLAFKQYIKEKPIKWGLKVMMLAESKTGYNFNFEVYTGRDTCFGHLVNMGLGQRVVLSLTKPIHDKGYCVYFDRFFTSPSLLQQMRLVGLTGCGTIIPTRIGFPAALRRQKHDLQRGEYDWLYCSNTEIKVVMKDVKEMFYFKVDLDYEYNVTLVQSKTFKEIRDDISKEIEKKMEPLSKVATFSNIIFLVLLFITFVRAAFYRRGFLSKDSYDNFYLTQSMYDLDKKRISMGKPSIMPLTQKETRKYIAPSSCRLVKAEKSKLFFGFVLYFGSLLHGGFFMFCDYGLYWMLQMIQREGELELKEEVPSHMKLHVKGNGAMADIYRSLITQFDPVDKVDYSMNTKACLPKPSEPNWDVYKTIGVIYSICLILVVTEAYLLRLRHVIAGCFYPERANDRCIWLYSHILRRRGNLLKHIRRDVHQNVTNSKDVETSSLSRCLARFPLLERLLAPLGFGYECCIACGTARQQGPENGMIHCDNYNCKGIYCGECYTDLNNMCTACMNPIDYGDFSDVSEERDSSDEQEAPLLRRRAPATSV